MIAFQNKLPVSGVFVIGNNNYMHYYKGATIYNVKNLGQGELLQWETIRELKKMDVKYYDLCNLNKKKLPSIYSFKTGICNNLVPYEIKTKKGLGFQIINKLNNIFE